MNASALEMSGQLRDMLTEPQLAKTAYVLGPGVYRNLPAEEYHALPGASASKLRKLERSPLHLLDSEDTETSSKEFGSAVHMAILEPELFAATHTIGPVDDRRLKAWKDFAATCPVTPVTPSFHQSVSACVHRIESHQAASWVLEKVTDRELTVVWFDQDTGVLCRARLDAIAPSIGSTVEIKTTRNAARSAFTRDAYAFRYYRQAAFYLDAAAQLGELSDLHEQGFHRHIVIAVENERPYAVNVFPIRGDAIQAGRDEIGPLLRIWKHCEALNDWPQASTEYSLDLSEDISLPPWAWAEVDKRRGAT